MDPMARTVQVDHTVTIIQSVTRTHKIVIRAIEHRALDFDDCLVTRWRMPRIMLFLLLFAVIN